MAEFTAAVTSMPGVLSPDSEASILLKLTAVFVLVVLAVDDKSELIEEVELIASTCFREDASLWIETSYPGALEFAANKQAIYERDESPRMKRRWSLLDSTSEVTLDTALNYWTSFRTAC
jgi:hypothetical protein